MSHQNMTSTASYFRPNFLYNINFNRPIRPHCNSPFNYAMDNLQNFTRIPSHLNYVQPRPVYTSFPTHKQVFGRLVKHLKTK